MLVLIALLLLTIIVIVHLHVRIGKVQKRYKNLFLGHEQTDIEKLILSYRQAIDDLKKEQTQLKQKSSKMERILNNVIMGIGLKRYNAFKDTGSDLSFSLALLNKQNQGVVLTSIFGREETRVYAKDVEEGKSNYNLSEEEVKALSQAQQTISQIEELEG